MAEQVLREFWAVTVTGSVYSAWVENVNNPIRARVRKIADLDRGAKTPIGHELKGGSLVAIHTNLQVYDATPKTERYEEVSTVHHGQSTGKIVGLFEDEQDALMCGDHADLVACDPRFEELTRTILERIGDEHPTFYICRDKRIGFPLARTR